MRGMRDLPLLVCDDVRVCVRAWVRSVSLFLSDKVLRIPGPEKPALRFLGDDRV